MTKFIFWLIELLSRFVRQNIEMVVFCLIHNTAQLALAPDEWVEFQPVRGTCGNIKLRGNSCPTFEYHVFDKSYMEFIKVKVEVAKPDKIHFISTVDQKGHTDQKRNGESVPLKDLYVEPFWELAYHLLRYFPYPRRSQELENYVSKKNENEGGSSGLGGIHREISQNTGAP